MAIEKIIEKIISESKSRAEEIIAEAQRQARDISDAEQAKAEVLKEKKIEKSTVDFENEKNKRIALSKLEARKKILQVRCDLVDECFDSALKQLNNLQGGQLRKLVLKLLENFVPEHPCEVIVYEPEKDKYSSLLSDIWKDAFDRHCRVVATTSRMGGGFILRTKKMEYDCTLTRIVQEIKPRIEQEVVSLLFPG